MPESARLLRFPSRHSMEGVSTTEAARRVEEYLAVELASRNDELRQRLVSDPETMLLLIGALRRVRDSKPAEAVVEGAAIYTWLSARRSFGTFDERDYFLGELALLTGGASRLLGRREQAERWFDRADSFFRHTLNPGPLLATTAYNRLALRHEMRRFEEVLELLPSLVNSFRKFGMMAEVTKCRLLEAVALKESGRSGEAISALLGLSADEDCQRDVAVYGIVLVNLGDLQSSEGQLAEALESYRGAACVLAEAGHSYALAHLKGAIGQTLRDQGNVAAAVSAFREAAAAYDALGIGTQSAYTRILTAESLLALGRPREAEFELLAALPTIDEEKMLPDAQAALNLLRESMKQRRLNEGTLSSLRKQLNLRA
jgi:tetratricopeptide (TPR) repeat protein